VAEADGIDFWDEGDAFFYDVLRLPGRHPERLRVRSIVGLIPIFAVEILDQDLLQHAPGFTARMHWFLDHRPDLAQLVSHFEETGCEGRRLLGLLRRFRLKSVLARMLDEQEFLSPTASARSRAPMPSTRTRWRSPTSASASPTSPASRRSGIFGGNSNWRGPIWMPVNYLLVESLRRFGRYYGDTFQVECPTGSGRKNEPRPGRRRARAEARRPVPARTRTGAARASATTRCSRTIRTFASTCCFTSTSTATVVAGSARRTRPDGRRSIGMLRRPARRARRDGGRRNEGER
jgi:hypothetical protein